MDFYRGVCVGVSSVLELGVGSGRIAAALARDGVSVVGVERDEDVVRLGRRLHPSPRIEWIVGDMRDVQLGRRFERILLPYNGLFTLATDDDVHACFENAARHLTDDGYFVFDFWVADPFHEHGEADPDGGDDLDERDGGGDGDGDGDGGDEPVAEIRYEGRDYDVYEATRWDRAAQRVDATYRFVPRRGGETLRSEVMSRYVLTKQLEPLLHAAGLEPLVRHGDFDQSAWDEDCERMIVTAQLRRPDRA
ncbi:MAG: class I SAM-dependent methyltransferase [Sandaracinaceae bacterium]|nr:class I SAM-dependent methyltransferase [Myxococcales bacterium]MCB9661135.1 class I SAM-dependent methyltransferase [Sandaracinaceae bacterium]